jgi:abnormal spindle-like microcephaly-associated protein
MRTGFFKEMNQYILTKFLHTMTGFFKEMNQYILTRFLHIMHTYIHNTYTHARTGFFKEMNQYILTKFLHIVLLLDRCKSAGAIDGCIFTTQTEIPSLHGHIKIPVVKTTKDMVARFAKELLSGEGDVIRHVSLLGMTLTYQQTALDEYSLRVSNLAVDLRDGVLLAHLVDILCVCKGDLRGKLRVPAISRMQKVHNVNLVVDKLKGHVLTQDSVTLSRDIVDGHREQTLGLLWLVLSHFQLPNVVSVYTLKEEITRVVLAARRTYASRQRNNVNNNNNNNNNNKKSRMADGLNMGVEKLAQETAPLLLQWCKAVCCSYGVPVHNFTTSMGDGKAFCLLINYYLPDLVPLSEIQCTRSDMISSCNDSDMNQFGDADIAERHGAFAYFDHLDRSTDEYATGSCA